MINCFAKEENKYLFAKPLHGNVAYFKCVLVQPVITDYLQHVFN